ncbi:malto-oligosyltrehalose synthase [Azohydromonas caseinilytica]|uniref:4-alpha-glucanotransferase n=1 Tax=Azohydromonas caseinilytica TaxID=2728836 RepID=A0A848FDV2_9BURK|nr:malto-oligosyltrehalose synthase [Azohydromonas caseinilytica]NML18387.1 malto-oligosyltrehalose synthase [Azohydromonas caseinilytica]
MAEGMLRRWCERLKVGTEWHDVWGNHHAVPDEGLKAILAELGVTALDEEAFDAAEAADWHRPLPQVLAVNAEAAHFELPIRLPREVRLLRWTLHQEDGAVHAYDANADTLPQLEQASVHGRAMRALLLTIGTRLPAGYHRLVLETEGIALGETLLIAAPARCWRPQELQGEGRVWGPALQLYALRSQRNWGIGDFSDLAELVADFGERGAGIVGLNPLHALFSHNPYHISPYSPSSRSQLNLIYLDVEVIEDFRECETAQALVRSAAFQNRLQQLREAPQVDYAGVASAKTEVLRRLYAHFRERHLDTASARGRAFRAFQADRGEPLRLFATFEALQAQFHARDAGVWGWPVWPEEYRDPRGEAVRRFQREQREAVEYHEYLQWQADQQLARVSHRCRSRGLAVGLYLDLAVSVDRAGADSWGQSSLYATGATVGAPPDEINVQGQDWGLPPLRPDRLLQTRLRFFIDTLRANMRHAGALRIDHVMGLMRLYWIPPQGGATKGAYVHYPLQELMAVVALESQRNRCMVIGEDLGTVADEMRAALAEAEVLSYRLLYFERGEGGSFKPPREYPRLALVAISTHDLPTLAGWWNGHDLQVRKGLGLYPDEKVYEEQLVARAQEKYRLLLALQHEDLLPEGVSIDLAHQPPLTQALVEAVHTYVARTPSYVQMVQLEDVLGVLDQPNLPGTVNEHPNWRQKLPLALDALRADARVQSLTAVLARERPHAPLKAAQLPRAQAAVPRATYRLQFHKDFNFEHGIAVLPYLQRLGVSHVYCSPLMRARAGSMHGYDVVAHDEFNPELGGREGFERFAAAAKELGLGLILDIVPNHMGVIGGHNAWWADVLEHGEASAYARYFDIDWQPVDPALHGKVLLPVLGQHYGQVLEAGELQLVFEPEQGTFALQYWEHRFPLDPRTVAPLLERASEHLDGAASLALQSLATACRHLPAREDAAPQARFERQRDQALLKERLVALLREDGRVQGAIEGAMAEWQTPDALDALHAAQAWRLAFWRVASDEINYRRFFDVNELAALRMEEPAVFEATHGLALELCAAGVVDGLRIDHPDGLHDPTQYFDWLQQGYARRVGLLLPEKDEQGRPPRPLYVVAEKIAAGHEDVPESWAVHGTTGYRAMNVLNGVLIDCAARERFDRIWQAVSGDDEPFEEMAYQGKQLIMRVSLSSELTVLATELLRIARSHRRTRDHSLNSLRRALAEVAACMPVYRTYIVRSPSAQDRRFIDWAVSAARRRSRAADTTVFDFVRSTLLAEAVDGADEALQERVRRFAMRFQQFTAPVTAKGVEDTAFYRYNRFLPVNEVGGEPGTFGMTLRAFHGANGDRAARWPHTMLATSTHDNKRSEDVRCRLDVLSEFPAAWRLSLRRFYKAPQLQRARVEAQEGHLMPSRADEYLLLQTLLGTLPAGGLTEEALPEYRERIERYALKAVREAKRHSSWVNPDAEYEEALLAFIRSALPRVKPNPLLTEIQSQAEILAWFGALNSLTLTLLKYTLPGVPDLYQGNELLDFSLVDPDNRRAVDYGQRTALLDEFERLRDSPDGLVNVQELTPSPHDGRLKLWLTWQLLQWRARQPALFRDGNYQPLSAAGERADHVVAFARETADGQRLVTVAGRFFARLLGFQPGWPLGEEAWGDTVVELPAWAEGLTLRNVLTGEKHVARNGRLRVAEVFETLPAGGLAVEG